MNWQYSWGVLRWSLALTLLGFVGQHTIVAAAMLVFAETLLEVSHKLKAHKWGADVTEGAHEKGS